MYLQELDQNPNGTQNNPYQVCHQAYLTMTQWQMCNQSYWNRPKFYQRSWTSPLGKQEYTFRHTIIEKVQKPKQPPKKWQPYRHYNQPIL